MWGEASTFISPAYNSSGRKIWLRLSKINSPLGWVQEWKILAGNNGLSENIGVTANWGICAHHRRLHATPPPPPQAPSPALPEYVLQAQWKEGGRKILRNCLFFSTVRPTSRLWLLEWWVASLSFCRFDSVSLCNYSTQLNVLCHDGGLGSFTRHNSYNPWMLKEGIIFRSNAADLMKPSLALESRLKSLSRAVAGGIQGLLKKMVLSWGAELSCQTHQVRCIWLFLPCHTAHSSRQRDL